MPEKSFDEMESNLMSEITSEGSSNFFHQRTIPPAGTPFVDNQGNSDACVRFALAKALSNLLFTKQKIDVPQRSIMNCLVQVKKGIWAMRPKEYHETVLYLQDEKNGKNVSDESFWEVKILIEDVTNELSENPNLYDYEEEYILGYSPAQLDPENMGNSKMNHCVYIARRYKCMDNKYPNTKVYECMNSFGFEKPLIFIEVGSKCIKNIYKIRAEVKLLSRSV